MPTYEYKCEACGHGFEKFHSIMASPIRKCPKCGKNKVKRLLGTGAGLIFKGSGFYITDYRSESYKSGAKAAEGAAGGTGASDAKSSDSKSSDSKSSDSTAKPATTTPPAPAKSEGKPSPKTSSDKKK